MFPGDESVYLIYAQPHVCAELPDDADTWISLKLLPPHSPSLNCTKMVYSVLKAAVKRDLIRAELQQRSLNQAATEQVGMIMREWRACVIQQIVRRNINYITPEYYSR